MAEAEEHPPKGEHKSGDAHEGAHAEGHGGHAEGPADPLHHIKDKVLLGMAADGKLVWKPYGDHGHAQVGYAPKMIGPMKLEFTKHMAGMTFGALVIFLVVTAVARRVKNSLHHDRAPEGPLANMVESLVVFVRDELVLPIGGHHLEHYTPLFLTYFFFILTLNLMGMIPEFGGVTGNWTVTLFLGVSIWFSLTLLGMYHQGPLHYFLHMVPPGTPWPMWPLMFVLEFLGPVIKCGVLCVRLFANMIAGHLVISNILALGVIGEKLATGLAVAMIFVGVPLALGISMLEILVCFIQAYVFTMLSIIFVSAAVHPEH
ncbi:MAG: F0F1 ATP synthase subunit A [Planctomycetota bacterium]|nr:F0F1 ATP synthase subunit A [Planctomycetota bacterium]